MCHLGWVKRTIAAVLLSAGFIFDSMAAGSKVELRPSSDQGWELLRNGEPYRILGVGGSGPLALAKKLGANSVRFWGIQQLEETDSSGKTNLAQIEELGLTFCAGLWLVHERHGFSYLDPEMVQEQRRKVREAVRRYKDHPNLLVWGLGNEMEIFPGRPEAVRVWKELEELAKIVKEEDPDHPVMTVIAGADENKVREIMEHYPSIDILGINAYSGAAGTGLRLRGLGWKKPFVITEYGPAGHWEVAKTTWGAPLEPNANEKAAQYYATLQSAMENKEGLCLGSYAFLWGNKQETTPTWYGMLLPGGEKLPSVDAAVRQWTGEWPANRSPKIESFRFDNGADRAKAGTRLEAVAVVSDRDDDELTYEWTVLAESTEIKYGGDAESVPPSFPEAVGSGRGPQCTVTLPPAGAYRLFLVVRDGQGGASTANLPFLSE
ncbi:MAG: glycoside hydrolase family 2 TIM barrel-domain containing protein [Chthoniobacterales bacterium]